MFLVNYNFNKFFLVFLPIFVCFLLTINAFSNNGGLPKLFKLNSMIKELENNLNVITKDADFLEHKVNLISIQPIDKDLLEELAHINTGLSYKTEYFIPYKKISN